MDPPVQAHLKLLYNHDSNTTCFLLTFLRWRHGSYEHTRLRSRLAQGARDVFTSLIGVSLTMIPEDMFVVFKLNKFSFVRGNSLFQIAFFDMSGGHV